MLLSSFAKAAVAKLCRRIIADPTCATRDDLVKIAKGFLLIVGEKL